MSEQDIEPVVFMKSLHKVTADAVSNRALTDSPLIFTSA